MKTTVVVKEGVEQKWFVVDATDQVLGRLASKVAHILRGKHKPYYAPHLDVGDYIIVTNAEKIHATGNKLLDKTYFRHTGYPSGLRTRTLGKVLAEKPTDVIEMAVKGMLPKNPLGRDMYRKLKVYAGPEHDHAAQKPEPLDLSKVKTESL